MASIRWSLQAAGEFEEICKYIEKDSLHYAEIFAKKVILALEKISQFPKIGRVIPEFSNPNYREIFYKSYRIFYRLTNNMVEIVSVFHGSKGDPSNWVTPKE